MFTENQVRQFYVANSAIASSESTAVTANDDPGKMKLVIKGDEAYFMYSGAIVGDLQRSDLIKKCNVMDVRLTAAADLVHKNKKAVVTLAGTPVVGQDYVLNVSIHNYVSMDYNTTKIKYGVARAASTTASDLYKAIATSLAKNFKREPTALVKVGISTAATGANPKWYGENWGSTTAAAIVIEEVEQPWRRGAAPVEYVNFTVEPSTIYDGTNDVVWGKVQFAGENKYTDGTASSTTITAGGTQVNSKKVADMEWFFHKERGDKYGEMCWPYNIDTVYQVDPANANGYSFVDIHFYFEGNSHNVGKSEKTLTIVGTKANLKTLVGAAATTGQSATPASGLFAWLEGTGVEIKKSATWDQA